MLNRRGFLASLIALIAAPFVPAPKPIGPTLMIDKFSGIRLRVITEWSADSWPEATAKMREVRAK